MSLSTWAPSAGYPRMLLAYLAGLSVITGTAHIVVRRWAPFADPVILPLVVTLNGLGLAMIHRLDQADAEAAALDGEAAPPVDAPVQLTWMVVGVALFVLVLILIRDYRMLSRLHLHRRPAGDRPAAPAARAGPRLRRARRADLDPDRSDDLPAGRGRQDRADHRVRRLPGADKGRARPRRAPGARRRPAQGARPRSDPHRLGQPRWASSPSNATSARRSSSSASSC